MGSHAICQEEVPYFDVSARFSSWISNVLGPPRARMLSQHVWSHYTENPNQGFSFRLGLQPWVQVCVKLLGGRVQDRV